VTVQVSDGISANSPITINVTDSAGSCL
jgi:hypothetical protein